MRKFKYNDNLYLILVLKLNILYLQEL